MTPRGILDELDRLGVVLWWQHHGGEPRLPTLRSDNKRVPAELAEQIELRTEDLLKIMRWEPSKGAASVRVRRPRPPASPTERGGGG